MKRFSLTKSTIGAACLLSIATSCSSSDTISDREEKKVSIENIEKLRRASTLMAPYVKLEGTKYIMTIGQDEALKLGLDSADYQFVYESIEQTNNIIAERMADGDTIELLDIAAIADSVYGVKNEVK
ncbi:MAG: hypothetical protein NC411_01810 [Bacteroides sp.]|nr:hypothetical protein [Bacteroides sp.]